MLQSFPQFRVTFPELLEQSYVLNGDYGLVCEGFEQLDLFVREGSYFQSTHQHKPNRNSFSHERGTEYGASASPLLENLGARKLGIDHCCEVVDVHGSALVDRSAWHRSLINGYFLCSAYMGNWPVRSH